MNNLFQDISESNLFENIPIEGKTFEVCKAFDDCEIKKADDGTYDFRVSATKRDMEGDIVVASGMDASYYKKNNLLLLQDHIARNDYIIGKGQRIFERDNAIYLTGVKFLEHGQAQFNKYLIDEGLTKPSIRFYPKAEEGSYEQITHKDGTRGYRYNKWILVEISLVTLPAFQDAARIREISKNFTPEIIDSIAKGATSYQNYSLDMNSSWDAGKARAQILRWAGGPDKDKVDWGKYRKGFFWFDSSEAQNIGSYKLPYVYIKGGGPVAVWRGVTAAMAALLGARGGVELPASDRRAVYNHIKKYYSKADKEAPEFRIFSDEEIIMLAKFSEKELSELLEKTDKYFHIFNESGDDTLGIITEETEKQIERLDNLLTRLKGGKENGH